MTTAEKEEVKYMKIEYEIYDEMHFYLQCLLRDVLPERESKALQPKNENYNS